MAYSILKSDYPCCSFMRLTDHCTVISSKDDKVKTGWSYSTCLYVLYGKLSNWYLYGLAKRSKYKDAYIAHLENQIKAKDKQIAKLTKQLARRSR